MLKLVLDVLQVCNNDLNRHIAHDSHHLHFNLRPSSLEDLHGSNVLLKFDLPLFQTHLPDDTTALDHWKVWHLQRGMCVENHSTINYPLAMRGFSDIMKQTGQKQIFEIEHNLVKMPQLAGGRQATYLQSSTWRNQRPNPSVTLPPIHAQAEKRVVF